VSIARLPNFSKGSDEEFNILLKLAFTRNRFQIEKIRRDVMIANDFLLNLTRIEKKGTFAKRERRPKRS